jgi:hypothetical protein
VTAIPRPESRLHAAGRTEVQERAPADPSFRSYRLLTTGRLLATTKRVKKAILRATVVLLSILVLGVVVASLSFASDGRKNQQIGQVVPCPTNDGAIPSGSTCRVAGDNTLTLVSLGPERPPCERIVDPPLGTIAETCKVLNTEGSDFGTSALLSYQTQEGREIQIWVLPGGKQFVLGQDG